MDYRYRVNGRAEKAFILRGMYFRIGSDISTVITETELEFVKSHCTINSVCEINPTCESIPANPSSATKGDENEQKPTSRTRKSKHTAQV